MLLGMVLLDGVLLDMAKKKKQLDDRSELKGQLLREPFDDEKMLEKQKSSPTLV